MDCNKSTEMLFSLLEKYGVDAQNDLSLKESEKGYFLCEGKREIPLLPWRQERRFIEMRALRESGRAGLVSTLRIGRMTQRTGALEPELLRELDLCEWLLGEKAAAVYAAENGPAINLIVTMCSGAVCTLELSAALAEGTPDMDRHEINTRRGVISDRAVDTQVPQDSIYLFSGDGKQTFTDVDFELYGLDAREVSVVRDAFEVLRDGLQQDRADRYTELEKLLAAVKASVQQDRCIDVSNGKEFSL